MIALAPPSSPGPTHPLSGLVRIADGVTPGGQHWHLRARASQGHYTAEISLPEPGGDGADGGAFETGVLPRAGYLSAEPGSGLGRQKDEYEVDGVVGAGVAQLRVTTVSGTVTFRPRTTPAAALKRYPALKRIKLYVKFLDAEPVKAEALDASGAVVATQKL